MPRATPRVARFFDTAPRRLYSVGRVSLYGGVMSKSFYFTRHGRVHSPDTVSEAGIGELGTTCMLLYAHAFRPKVAVSSPTNRCFQTASFYMAGKEDRVMTLEALHVFGDIVQMREKAGEVLDLIEKAAGAEREIVVVSHDSMSVALAWTVLERRGVAVNWWLPRELRFLDQGEGLLVKDRTYWHLHAKAKVKIR